MKRLEDFEEWPEVEDKGRYEKDLKDDTCGNFNARLSREIVRQVKDLFDELTGRKAVQLSFF